MKEYSASEGGIYDRLLRQHHLHKYFPSFSLYLFTNLSSSNLPKYVCKYLYFLLPFSGIFLIITSDNDDSTDFIELV